MLRTFEIRDTPNEEGFDRYTVRVDNGSPYEDTPPIVTTADPLKLMGILLAWLKEGEE